MNTLLSRPIVVLDTETTGLQRDADARPWQLAAVLLDLDGQEAAVFDEDMRPDPFPDSRSVRECLAYLHVERSLIEAAPLAVEVIARFASWWVDLGRPMVTAFNASFDREMLARAGWREDYWDRCIMRAAWTIMDADPACPVRRWDNGELKYPTLAEAAAYFAAPVVEPQHRALSDVRTAAGVLLALQRRALARRLAREQG